MSKCPRCHRIVYSTWYYCTKCGFQTQAAPRERVKMKPSTTSVILSKVYDDESKSSKGKQRRIRAANSDRVDVEKCDLPEHLRNEYIKLLESTGDIFSTNRSESTVEQLRASVVLESKNAVDIESALISIKRQNRQPWHEESYLDDEPSVSSQYEDFLKREKELKNLRSACSERLLSPSDHKRENKVAAMSIAEDLEEENDEVEEEDKAGFAMLWNLPIRDWTEVVLERNHALSPANSSIVDQPVAVSEKMEDAPIMFWSTALLDEPSTETLAESEEATEDVGEPEVPRLEIQEKDSDCRGKRDLRAYAVIGRLYYASYKSLIAASQEADVRFKEKNLLAPAYLRTLLTRIEKLNAAIDNASDVEDEVHREFEDYTRRCCESRSAAALAISEQLALAADHNQEYSRRYEAARLAFEARSNSEGQFVSSTGRHINSDAAMDAIRASADEEWQVLHSRLEKLQEEEADLLKHIRSMDVTMLRVLDKWKPKHAAAILECRTTLARVEGVRCNSAARIIQSAAK